MPVAPIFFSVFHMIERVYTDLGGDDLNREVAQDHIWPVDHQKRRHPGDESETQIQAKRLRF